MSPYQLKAALAVDISQATIHNLKAFSLRGFCEGAEFASFLLFLPHNLEDHYSVSAATLSNLVRP